MAEPYDPWRLDDFESKLHEWVRPFRSLSNSPSSSAAFLAQLDLTDLATVNARPCTSTALHEHSAA